MVESQFSGSYLPSNRCLRKSNKAFCIMSVTCHAGVRGEGRSQALEPPGGPPAGHPFPPFKTLEMKRLLKGWELPQGLGPLMQPDSTDLLSGISKRGLKNFSWESGPS